MFSTKHSTKIMLTWMGAMLLLTSYVREEHKRGNKLSDEESEEEKPHEDSQLALKLHSWIVKLGLDRTTHDVYKKK